MPNVTVAFDELVKGWTSEFTFVPDGGLSLNNNFYTFHDGRLWRHNSENVDRNTFYGITSDTLIKFVFNHDPTIPKNFKTLGYEGLGEWNAELETNLENGEVQASWFLEKDGKKYSWIRGVDTGITMPDLSASSVQGIGVADTNTGSSQITFGAGVDLSSVSVGDLLYTVERSGGAPSVVGRVTRIDQRRIAFDEMGLPGDTTTVDPVSGNFILHAKPSQDKSGIIGYYSIVTMTLPPGEDGMREGELFSVNTDTFIQTK